MIKTYRRCFLALTSAAVIFSACSPIYREEYLRGVNNRMQLLAKMYNAKISPLTPDSNLKVQSKKINKKEIDTAEADLLNLERYLATKPDSIITHMNMNFTTPSEVTKEDSVYVNANKWDYLQRHGLVTKDKYFRPKASK